MQIIDFSRLIWNLQSLIYAGYHIQSKKTSDVNHASYSFNYICDEYAALVEKFFVGMVVR